MKKIKIFIASSTGEFKDERNELGNYILSLNNICEKWDMTFQLILCENLSPAMVQGRKQEEFNAHIRTSQYFYVLIGRTAGKYTVEEFEVAWKQFQTTAFPKPYAYIRDYPNEKTDISVVAFKNRLRELGQYYKPYPHVDTIKLRILLEFTSDEVSAGTLKFEDGQAKLDGKTVLNLDNVPMYSKNDTIQDLLRRKQKLEEEFTALAVIADNSIIDRMRFENIARRNDLTEKLHKLEMEVLNLYSALSKKQNTSEPINWREEAATQLLEKGDYQGALNILRDSAWETEVEQSEESIERKLSDIRSYIRGNRMRILTLMAQGITQASIPEITKCYEISVSLAEKYHIELSILYDYLGFLLNQHNLILAIRIGKRLEKWYDLDNATQDDLAKLKNRLGACYYENHQLDMAESYYRASLAIRRELAESNHETYDSEVANSCNNLAILMGDLGNRTEAEALHQEALTIRCRLASNNPTRYDSDVAQTCHNFGNFLKNANRMAEAEPYYRRALDIRRKLFQTNPVAFEKHIAWTENNLAILLRNTNHLEESESLFRDSLEIRRRLAFTNPAAYDPFVAKTCLDFGILLCLRGNVEESEKLLFEAYSTRKRLAENNPPAYEPEIARTCYFIALLELKKNNKSRAKEMFETALSLYAKYPHISKYVEYCRNQLKENF